MRRGEGAYTKRKDGERKSRRRVARRKVLDKRLGGNTSTNRVLFNLLPLLSLSLSSAPTLSLLLFLRAYEHIDAGASTPSGAFMLGHGRESRREINRLSFARFLVRKVVKHEVYGEINFTNPFCKKPETRKVPAGCNPKDLIGYEVCPRERRRG